MLLQPINCEPNSVLKSSVQDDIDKSKLELSSFTVFDKSGDCIVPANLGLRFYNVDFDKFDASAGGNTLYFENCTFKQPFSIIDGNAVMAGCKLRAGGTVTRTKLELVPIVAANPTYDPTALAPTEEVPDYIVGESGLGASNAWEYNISYPCIVNNSLHCVEYSDIASSYTIWEWTESVLDIINDISDKAMLVMEAFSTFYGYLDKFLNIPFQILSLIDGCVSKMIGTVFSAVDKLLGPIFKTLNSVTAIFNAIRNLVATVKNIASTIARIIRGSVARFVSLPYMLAAKTAFVLDIKGRLECQLVGRIVAMQGSVVQLAGQARATFKDVQSLYGGGNQPTIWQTVGLTDLFTPGKAGSIVNIANVVSIQAQSGMVCSLQNNSTLRLFGVKSVATGGAVPAIKSVDPAGGGCDIHCSGVGTIFSTGGMALDITNGKSVTLNNTTSIESTGGSPSMNLINTNTVLKGVESVIGTIMSSVGSLFISKTKSVAAPLGGNAIIAKDGANVTIEADLVGATFDSAFFIENASVIVKNTKVSSALADCANLIGNGSFRAINCALSGSTGVVGLS